MTTKLHWPLGRVGDRVLVVLGEGNADQLAPLLGGEPESEDGAADTIVPLGIPDLDIPPEQLVDELKGGPKDVWLFFPRSEEAYDFLKSVSEASIEAGLAPPAAAFLPEGLQLRDVLDRLPSGRDALAPGRPSRHRLLREILVSLWVADAPDGWLKPFILRQAAGK